MTKNENTNKKFNKKKYIIAAGCILAGAAVGYACYRYGQYSIIKLDDGLFVPIADSIKNGKLHVIQLTDHRCGVSYDLIAVPYKMGSKIVENDTFKILNSK